MGPLALLGFAALCAGLGRAEVVGNFSECKQFFYKGEAPKGFDWNTKANICQRYANLYHFATLYDKRSRIPVWSAYTLDLTKCRLKTTELWKVEPQLSGLSGADMQTEGQLKKLKKDVKKVTSNPQHIKTTLKGTQAIYEDYEKTGFDRGHLNPNSFQCGAGRNATFTLTNAVPMDPCFNQVHWSELEKKLKAQLTLNCSAPENTAFLVTGVVPNDQHKIPIQTDDNRRRIKRDAGRVVIPSHIWTAVCCNHSSDTEKFAFAFLGKNSPGSTLEPMTVTQLNKQLEQLYRKPGTGLQVFRDGCNEGGQKAQEVLSAITNQLCNDFPNWVQDACQQTEPSPPKRPKSV